MGKETSNVTEQKLFLKKHDFFLYEIILFSIWQNFPH